MKTFDTMNNREKSLHCARVGDRLTRMGDKEGADRFYRFAVEYILQDKAAN